MSRPEKIIDLIDAGLGSSLEDGYGTDRWPELCARCQAAEPAEGGDLCTGCRAFLLGDSDADPRQPRRAPRLIFRADQLTWWPQGGVVPVVVLPEGWGDE